MTKSIRALAEEFAQGWLNDGATGNAPGLDLADYIEVAIKQALGEPCPACSAAKGGGQEAVHSPAPEPGAHMKRSCLPPWARELVGKNATQKLEAGGYQVYIESEVLALSERAAVSFDRDSARRAWLEYAKDLESKNAAIHRLERDLREAQLAMAARGDCPNQERS